MVKVDGQGTCALVAGFRLFGQRFGQDVAERQRHPGVDFVGCPRLHAGMQLAPVQRVAPAQGQLAQQQLVEDRAQGIDVAALIAAGAMGAQLLWCQIGPVADRHLLCAALHLSVGAKATKPNT
ncbi:hypothetical protein D3C81_725840 [compost metagenome]